MFACNYLHSGNSVKSGNPMPVDVAGLTLSYSF